MPGKKSITVSNELLNIYINWTRKHSSRISTARFCGSGGGGAYGPGGTFLQGVWSCGGRGGYGLAECIHGVAFNYSALKHTVCFGNVLDCTQKICFVTVYVEFLDTVHCL